MSYFRLLLSVLIIIYFYNVNPASGAVSCLTGYIESKTHRYRSNITECIFPSSEFEIQQIILKAINDLKIYNKTTTIRAIGASISYSALGMLDGTYDNIIVINTTKNFNQIIHFNQTDNTLTFQSGCRLIQILQYLHQLNLSLPYYDGPSYANFVGWFASGTSGRSGIIGYSDSNSLTKIMANNVIGLKIVIGNGSIIEIDSRNGFNINKHLLPAVLVNFGSLGIITQVTIKTKPLFYVTRYPLYKKYVGNISNNMTNNIQHLFLNELIPMAQYNYSKTFYLFKLFEETMYGILHNNHLFNETDKSLNITNRCWINSEHIDQETKFEQELIGRMHLDDDIIYNPSLPCTDVYYKAIYEPPTVGNRLQQSEFILKSEYLLDAYLLIVNYFMQHKHNKTSLWNDTYQLYVIENSLNKWTISIMCKWIYGDNIWLSQGYNQTQMVMVGIIFETNTPYEMVDKWVNPIYHLLNQRFLNITPIRVNWAKVSLSNYCLLQKSYPKLNDFKQIRNKFDPYNLFLNSFTRDKLGICKDVAIDEMDECCCTNYTCIKPFNANQNDSHCF